MLCRKNIKIIIKQLRDTAEGDAHANTDRTAHRDQYNVRLFQTDVAARLMLDLIRRATPSEHLHNL